MQLICPKFGLLKLLQFNLCKTYNYFSCDAAGRQCVFCI